MKNKHSASKILLIFPSLVLTSCGYGLKEVYDGIPYNSTNFTENYYMVWDKNIDYRKDNNSITKTEEKRILDYDKDKVFLRMNDDDDYKHYQECEKNWLTYEYTYDKVEPEVTNKKAYGPAVRLSNQDSSFKYGVSSKLFDGQMFCNGDFQHSRTQVGSTNLGNYGGFAVRFAKECSYYEYFMCNFKCSYVTSLSQNLNFHYSDITLKLGFYLRNEQGFTYVPVEYDIEKVPTNSGDDHFVPPYSGRLSSYICFGFKLHQEKDDGLLDLSRLVGISFEYQLNKIWTSSNPSTEVDLNPSEYTPYHSIMLYEISLPHSTWH